MQALDVIAKSIKVGYVHPTDIMNTLIEVENAGGSVAVRQLERRLSICLSALMQRKHPNYAVAEKWLGSTRAYLVVEAERKQVI